jgi:hypothetical protein
MEEKVMDDFLDADTATVEEGQSMELYVSPETGSLPPAIATADLMNKSGLFPTARNTAGVFTIVQFGREVGLSPVVALNNVAVISGKLSMSGASMLALACKHGVRADFKLETEEKCVINFTREGFPDYSSEFTMEDAKKADLLKSDAWAKYPKVMLRWRAVAQGLRIVAPDILAGVYTEDEIRNIEPSTPSVQDDTPTVSETVPETVQEEAEVSDIPEETITEGQMKRLHVLMNEKGVTPFKDGFKLFLLTFDGTGMSPDKPSATQLTKEFASVLVGDFTKYASMFFASPKSVSYLDKAFGVLKRGAKASVIAGMKTMVKGGDSLPITIKEDTPDTMVTDWFVLLRTALTNQEENRIVDEGKKRGMSVDEVVDTLDELGMNPEVKEEIKPEETKEEPKEQESKKDDLMPF